MQSPTMSFMSWFQTRKSDHKGKSALERARNAFRETTMPLISPRRGRRLLRREQVFGVVRESLIRGGVLSTSYSFKVLALDNNGDSFLVLVDLALPAQAMPDEYLLEIERWVQESAKARHTMEVRAVYWRRKPSPEQVGQALKAAMATQARRESELYSGATAIPRPKVAPSRGPVQAGTLGYWVGQPFARQGYMREAVLAACDWAFHRLDLCRIEAGIVPGNERSRRVLEGTGFAEEGRASAYLEIAGQRRDHILFALVRADIRR